MDYRERLVTIVALFSACLLLSARLIDYPLHHTMEIAALAGIGVWVAHSFSIGHVGLWRFLKWIIRNLAPVVRGILQSPRISHLWLSFFLLTFAITQTMLVDSGVSGALGAFSEFVTGDQSVTWLIVLVMGSTGVAVYVFREMQWLFYWGILQVSGYVLILLYTTVTGLVSPLAWLAALYLTYGAGGNVLTLVAYIYNRDTQKLLSERSAELDEAKRRIEAQAEELSQMRREIAYIKERTPIG